MPVINSFDKSLLVPNIEEEDPVTDIEVLSDRNHLSPILSHGTDSDVYVSTEEGKPSGISESCFPKNIVHSEDTTDSEHFDNSDHEDIVPENSYDAEIPECYFEDNEFHDEKVAYQSKSSVHKNYNHKQMQSYICQAKKRRSNLDNTQNDHSSDEEKSYRDLKQKCRRRKFRRHSGRCKKRTADTHTDEEELRNTSSASDQEEVSSKMQNLRVGDYTDSDQVSVSDLENIVPSPVQKQVSAEIPEPVNEYVAVAEKNAVITNEPLVDTDEEDFGIDEHEDSKPLKRTKLVQVISAPTAQLLSPAPNNYEPVLTDSENFSMEEKEEEDILGDMYIEKESNILASDNFSCDSATFSNEKSVAKTKTLSVNNEARESLTDTEEIDNQGKTISVESKRTKHAEDTDSDSIDASDDNMYESSRPPLSSQLSEIRFVESKGAPVTIIVTPSSAPDVSRDPITYNIDGIKFFDDIEQEGSLMELSDIENCHDGTDDENFDIDDLPSRPETPLPPEDFRIIPSPVREMIHLTENESGASVMKIEKLSDDYENEELLKEELTDSEDADMPEADFNGIIKWSDGDINVLSQLDEATEITSKCRFKKIVREKFIRPIQVISRMNRLTQNRTEGNKLPGPPVLIVQEVDDHEGKSDVKKEFVHTDCEDFEMSGNEDIVHQYPSEINCPTPEALRTVPLKRTIICSENPGGGTKTEICDFNVPKTTFLNVVEDQAAVTDTEEIEIPEEDRLHTIIEDTSLPEAESQFVYVKEKANLPFCKESEELNIKNSYLLPDQDSHTDVESLNEDGNRA